ncbi:atrial natriuretic peptide receptor 1-like [Paramacrobiotus metropolitanus]|uniref:atrial natriuretic peptide receptor 1-like n=1 Tax=Paramacrobiotus metropolitanus TaxID=2943436 RepID=UPI00244579D0|nr:atrial natriuretic peptide receptor 1-like [Paramacrobiotus metropolitanus]
MIRAYIRNQTNEEYVWFAVNLAEHSLGPPTWQRFEVDDEIAKVAYRGLLQIINCWDYDTGIDRLRAEWRRRTALDYNSTYPLKSGPNEFSVTAYALVHTLAQAINESIAAGEDTTNARLLTKRLQNRQFLVPVIGAFRIDQYGERQNKVCVNAFSTLTGEFERKMICDSTNSKVKSIPGTNITWATKTGLPPPSQPWCGFTGDAERCRKPDSTVATVLGVCLPVLMMLVAMGFYIKHRIQRMHDFWWKMPVERLADIQALPELKSLNQRNQNENSFTGKCLMVPEEQIVWVHNSAVPPNAPFPDRKSLCALRKLREFSHPNVGLLYGIIAVDGRLLMVNDFAEKGSLADILKTAEMQDPDLRISLAGDFIEGLYAIHHSSLKRHGRLHLKRCLVNKRFVLQISGLAYIDILKDVTQEKDMDYVAPELRVQSMDLWSRSTTSASDIFVFSCIIKQLLPEYTDPEEHSNISPAVAAGFQSLVAKCRENDPGQRPTINVIRRVFSKMFDTGKRNLTDNILQRLQRHAFQLEDAVTERTHELVKEIDANQTLLSELLPRQIVIRLKTEKTIPPEHFECISLMFSYTVGFAEFVIDNTDYPLLIIKFLDEMFLSFDNIVGRYDAYKVETINDSYMVASGVPERNETRHAQEICFCAQGFRKAFPEIARRMSHSLNVKIGINTGPCVAGIVGTTRPRYCLFGDTINTASRVAANNTDWTIQITQATKDLIGQTALPTEYRGQVFFKGKGNLEIYCLLE